MKKKTLLLIVALAVIAAGIGSTISYFSSRDTADNVFTVGDVKIELTEPSWDPDADHIIAPGESFDKDPTVTNTGSNDAYVRLNVVVRDYSKVKDAISGGSDPKVEPNTLFNSSIDLDKWIDVPEVIDEGKDQATYSFLYNEILKVGDSTGALFDKVEFPGSVDMDKVIALPGDGVTIDVTADAIQSSGFDNAEEAFEAFDYK